MKKLNQKLNAALFAMAALVFLIPMAADAAITKSGGGATVTLNPITNIGKGIININGTYDATKFAAGEVVCIIPYIGAGNYPNGLLSDIRMVMGNGGQLVGQWIIIFTTDNPVYNRTPFWCQRAVSGIFNYYIGGLPLGNYASIGFAVVRGTETTGTGYNWTVSGPGQYANATIPAYTPTSNPLFPDYPKSLLMQQPGPIAQITTLDDFMPFSVTQNPTPPPQTSTAPPIVSLYANGTLATPGWNVSLTVAENQTFTLKAIGTNNPASCAFYRGDRNTSGSFAWHSPGFSFNCSKYQVDTPVAPADFGMVADNYYIFESSMLNSAGQGDSSPIIIHVIPAAPKNPPTAGIYVPVGNPYTTPSGSNIFFSGYGTVSSQTDYITGYEWSEGSCGGTFLSSNNAFFKSDLSVGLHSIFLRVKDLYNLWSPCTSVSVKITAPCASNLGSSCQSQSNVCGQTNAGTIQCDGTCSVSQTPPPNSNCPVNGGWSNWSSCSVTACGSTGTETRACNNPSPANGGAACSGASLQNCTTPACPPSCSSFYSSPSQIVQGSQSTLSWSCSNATSCSINNGIGSVNPTSGSTTVTPSQTTSYSISCNGPGGTTSPSPVTTLTVYELPVCTFYSSPSTIVPPQSTSLIWSCSKTTSCSIDNGIGSVAPSGSTTVSPTQTTAYTLTCLGAGNSQIQARSSLQATVRTTKFQIQEISP